MEPLRPWEVVGISAEIHDGAHSSRRTSWVQRVKSRLHVKNEMVNLHFKVLDSLQSGPKNRKLKKRIRVIETDDVMIVLIFACSYAALCERHPQIAFSRRRLSISGKNVSLMNSPVVAHAGRD